MTDNGKQQRSLVERLRRAWFSAFIDNALLCGGLIAMLAHASRDGDPGPMAYAVLACLIVVGRVSDRQHALLTKLQQGKD